jgi:nucleotide-binding universal stress UspA family protein
MTESTFPRVLVGWDASTGATEGLRLGLRLSAVTGGRLTALAVLPESSRRHDARSDGEADIRPRLQAAYDAVLAEQQLVPGQQAALEFVAAPEVGKTLDRYAATHPVNVVIVGLHGPQALLHARMGHVASHAIQTGHCPVLVVPEPEGSVPEPAASESHGGRLAHLFHPFGQHQDTAT